MGMESHDYHIEMQEILPLCMWHLMTKECRMTIIHLCWVFKRLCAKVVDLVVMGDLKKEVAITLALLEQESPPFFVVMTHLSIHLVKELELCGLVQTWWMYPIERYLKTLKGYVGNITKLEGSMAKKYKVEKVVGLCIEYLVDFIATRCRVWDDNEDPSMFDEVLKSGGHPRIMIIDLGTWPFLYCFKMWE